MEAQEFAAIPLFNTMAQSLVQLNAPRAVRNVGAYRLQSQMPPDDLHGHT